MGHEPLRALAAASLTGVVSNGFVRREFVDDLIDRLLPEHPSFYGEMLWILMMLGQWLGVHDATETAKTKLRADQMWDSQTSFQPGSDAGVE